jgi:hypothetical protein
MSDEERLKLIIAYRRQRMSWRDIGTCVGMSPNGAMQAYRRATEHPKTPPHTEEENGW